MANPVVQTATCTCSFGAAPAVLTVTSQQTVSICKMPAATIQDGAALSNVPTFGMCSNPANPTVASATAAAMGVLTPMPCVPRHGGLGPGLSHGDGVQAAAAEQHQQADLFLRGRDPGDRDPGHDGEGAVSADRRQRGGLGHGGVRPAGRFL